jgi:hypothetical protein
MKKYGMFTESGNAAVQKIVECAEVAGLPFFVVDNMLKALAEFQPYAEATDTEVREVVYSELFGYYTKNVDNVELEV